jgi:hypothetical protein
MPALNNVVKGLPVRKSDIKSATYLIAAWILHSNNAHYTRNELKKLGMTSAEISMSMERVKYNHDIYTWKIQNLAEMKKRRKHIITRFGKLVTPAPIAQPLDLKEAEAVLEKALKDVKPIINSLCRKRLRFVEDLLHGSPRSQLLERAVLTFRWEYPFSRKPGAALNTALTNYANNIIRDATAQRRMPYIGVKSEGTLECLVVNLDNIDHLPNSNETISDMVLDTVRLSSLEQIIVNEIVHHNAFDNPDTIVKELCRQFRIEAREVRRVFASMSNYISGHGNSFDLAVADREVSSFFC